MVPLIPEAVSLCETRNAIQTIDGKFMLDNLYNYASRKYCFPYGIMLIFYVPVYTIQQKKGLQAEVPLKNIK